MHFTIKINRIGGVIVSVRYIVGSSPGRVKPMTIKLVFVASPLSTYSSIKEKEQRRWLIIKIMCLGGATCLPTDCCFSELAL